MNNKKTFYFISFIIIATFFSSELAAGRKYFTAWSSYEFNDTWKKITSHGGEFNCKILISSEQKYTYLVGEVKYCGPGEKKVTETFQKEINFTTGDCWSNIEVRFKSAPNVIKVNGWIIMGGAKGKQNININSKYKKPKPTPKPTNQFFLIGEWECQDYGNRFRMRVKWDDIGGRFEGTLTKQGQGSEYVGFSLGELCWIATPTAEENVLIEDQKFRRGLNRVSIGYEWRKGTVNLEKCTNNKLITSFAKYLRVN